MKLGTSNPQVTILWICLIGSVLLRGWFAAVCELSPDEAYYWVWSTRLAVGYYDHGPAVAWLIRLGTTLLGDTELGVRLGALICSLITIWMVFIITREVTSSSSHALWAALLMSATPILSAGAVVHTPDAVLTAAWAGAVWLGLRAFRRSSTLNWIGMGICLGLALLAKLTGALLLVGLAVFLVSCTMARQTLKSTGPVLALLAATLVSLPNLVWNLRHEGGSFAFQLQHGTSGTELSPMHFLSFLGGQIGVVSPVLWIALVVFMTVGWRRMVRFARSDVYFLWCFSAPILLLFSALALVHKVEANWPAVAYLAAVPGAAWSWNGGQWFVKRLHAWVLGALGCALVFTLLIHLQVLVPFLPLDQNQDPTSRLRGWRQLSEEAVREADSLDAILASEGYGSVSQLRFYTRREVAYEPSTSRVSQYDLWEQIPFDKTVLFLQPKTSPHIPKMCRNARERWLLTKEKATPADAWRRAYAYRWWVCEPEAPGG